MSSKVIRADGVGYHNAIPEILEQEFTIKCRIETRPVDEDGNVLPPRKEVTFDFSENCSPLDALMMIAEAIQNAAVTINMQNQQQAEAFQQLVRQKAGMKGLVQ